MRSDRIRHLIKKHLTYEQLVDDHGTSVRRRRSYTLAALTKVINDSGLSKFTRAEVKAVLARMSMVVARRHRPSGELMYSWVSHSDVMWATTNPRRYSINADGVNYATVATTLSL